MIKNVRLALIAVSVAVVTGCSSLSPLQLQRDVANSNRSVSAPVKSTSSEEPSGNVVAIRSGNNVPRPGKEATRELPKESTKEGTRDNAKEEAPLAVAAKQESEASRPPAIESEAPASRKSELTKSKADGSDNEAARRALAQGDFAKAAQIYRNAADDGDTQAQIALGDLYANGRGVALDFGNAIKWYQSAHKAGDSAALARIAYLTTQGWGVVKNVEKGVELLQAAAAKGDAFARGKLGLMYMRGSLESKLWICGPVAQACVPEAAVTLFQGGVADSDAEASYFLGEFYRAGRGVPQDEEEAFRLLKKSADQGHSRAMQALGTLYLQGSNTVPQDVGKGIAWLKAAASQNLAEAQNALGVLYVDGKLVPANTKEAVMWYQRAAEQGHAIAQANLAHMYRFGHGVKRELVTAYKWYAIAAQQFLSTSPGMKVAADISKRALEATMAPGDIEKAKSQALQWLERNQKVEL